MSTNYIYGKYDGENEDYEYKVDRDKAKKYLLERKIYKKLKSFSNNDNDFMFQVQQRLDLVIHKKDLERLNNIDDVKVLLNELFHYKRANLFYNKFKKN